MKSALLVFVAASVLSLRSLAQVPSIKEGVAFQLRPSLNVWREVIQNQGSSALVAFHVSFHCPKDGPLVRYDALFHYGHNSNIPPGGSVEIDAGDPSKCSGTVDAAIFLDGHNEGEAQSLNELYAMRRGAYTALGDSIQLLNAIANKTESPQHVIDTLETRSQENRREMTANAAGYAFICLIVTRTLNNPRLSVHVPSDDTAQRLPGIDEVMNLQNISANQAQAVVLSKKLQQWHSALEVNLEPPAVN
jgi:hypothetical protein